MNSNNLQATSINPEIIFLSGLQQTIVPCGSTLNVTNYESNNSLIGTILNASIDTFSYSWVVNSNSFTTQAISTLPYTGNATYTLTITDLSGTLLPVTCSVTLVQIYTIPNSIDINLTLFSPYSGVQNLECNSVTYANINQSYLTVNTSGSVTITDPCGIITYGQSILITKPGVYNITVTEGSNNNTCQITILSNKIMNCSCFQ